MAIKAVKNLIEKHNVIISDVDMIIVSTFTPDHLSPNVSALVQGHFGIEQAGTMDINSGCTGYTILSHMLLEQEIDMVRNLIQE